MKHPLLQMAILLTSTAAFSQTNNDSLVVNDSIAAVQKTVETNSSGSSFLDGLIAVLIICAVIFIIGHMIYTLFKVKQFSGQNYSIEFFKSFRQEKGMPDESTEDENEKCADLLDAAFLTWTHIETGEDGHELRKPNKMKEILKSGELLRQAVELAPTDPEIVTTLNQYKEVVTSNEARSFDGSKKLVGLGLAVAILLSLISMDAMGSFFAAFFTIGMWFVVPSIVYVISSYTPQFLIDKRSERGGGNVATGFVAIAMGVLGGGYTIRTHYTDGSTEDDNSGHFMAWALGFILMVIIAFTIFIWAFINYLRNYVLFF